MSLAIRLAAESKYPLNNSLGRDYKAWAKRIIYRFEHGDKTLLNIQIPFAYAAMELPVPKPADAI